MLLKVSAAKLPGDHETLALPEMVGSLSSALGGASGDAEMRERSFIRVRGQDRWVGVTHLLEEEEEKLGWADCLTGWGLKAGAGACWKFP